MPASPEQPRQAVNAEHRADEGKRYTLAEAEQTGIPIIRKRGGGASSPDASDPSLAAFIMDLKEHSNMQKGASSSVDEDVAALLSGIKNGFSSPDEGRKLAQKLQQDIKDQGAGANGKLEQDVATLLKGFDRSNIVSVAVESTGSPPPQGLPVSMQNTADMTFPQR